MNASRPETDLSRRDWLLAAALAAGAGLTGGLPRAFAQDGDADVAKRMTRVLFFTKSQGFQHSVVTRADNNSDAKLAHAEQILVDIGKQNSFAVTATKDGRIFTKKSLEAFDLFVFYTTGDLEKEGTDGTPPMPAGGQNLLIEQVRAGKGFVGVHCGCDTFHTPDQGPDKGKIQPYIAMVGGEFRRHGSQQKSKVTAAVKNLGGRTLHDFELHEEWYQFKNEAADRTPILIQETASMQEKEYTAEKPYPNTWTRQEGKGRVFYTSLGHREDVWTNEIFQNVLLAGMTWTRNI